MNAIKAMGIRVDSGIEQLVHRAVWSVVNFNSYRVVAALLFMMAYAVDVNPHSAFLVWAQSVNSWATPAVWKYSFLLCSIILFMAKRYSLGFWLFIFSAPLLAVIYYLLRAILAGYIPNELFSYVTLAWLFGITTMFMLRAVLLDVLLHEMGSIQSELAAARVKLKTLEEAGTAGGTTSEE